MARFRAFLDTGAGFALILAIYVVGSCLTYYSDIKRLGAMLVGAAFLLALLTVVEIQIDLRKTIPADKRTTS